MKKQDGVALIATLLIMAAITALGVGSLFLSNMNLRIAENSRTQAAARYNAEAGIEAALIRLEREVETNKKFPDTLVLPSSPDTSITYQLMTPASDGYKVNASKTAAEVRIVGTGPNGARYQTEAYLSSTSVAGGLSAERYGRGLVSEGVLNINGKATYTDALLHGNKGFTVNGQGTFQTCLERNAFGECVRFQAIPDPDLPITAAQGENATCNFYASNPAVCSGGRPQKLIEKETINVNYLDRRSDVIGKALNLERFRDANMQNVRDETQTYTYTTPSLLDPGQTKPSTGSQIKVSGSLTSAPYSTGCTKTISSNVSYNKTSEVTAAGFTSGSVVCVAGGVTFPDGTNLTGVTIIADGTVQFNGNADVTLDKTTIVSRSGAVNINSNGLTLKSATIFSNGDLNLNGQKTEYEGDTTLASNGSINVNGSSKVTRDAQGNVSIGLALIAQRDININGSSDWYATSVAGGNVNYNGSATLYGGVSAKGNITINGSFDVDSGLPISNSNLQETTTGSAEMQVVSRR
jgi:hypothetical protein